MLNPTPAQVKACRQEYGDAHDNQVAFAGECGWCGYYDPTIEAGTVADNGNVYTASGDLLEQHSWEA